MTSDAKPSGRRRLLSTFLGAAASVVLLAAVGLWISRQETPRLPDSPSELALLGLAVVVYLAITVSRGWRWHRIMRHAAIPHARRDAIELTTVAYMGNTVLPARGGEALRVVLLSRRSTGERPPLTVLIGTLLTERIMDVLALVGVVAILFAAGTGDGLVSANVALGTAVAVAIGAALLVLYERHRRHDRFERLAARIRPLAAGSKIFWHPEGARLVGLSLAIWIAEAVVLLIVAASIGVGLDPFEALLCVTVATAAAIVPSGPGYLGTFDAALLFSLHNVDVTGGAAVGLLLLYRLVIFVPVTAAGLLLLLTRYGGLRRVRRSERSPSVRAA